MIARLVTQRACLRLARDLVVKMPGPVVELGLGKARTYDHLLGLFPDRAVYAFDRGIYCPPEAVPPADRLVLGEFDDTLPRAAARLGALAALVHVDMGTADRDSDAGPARRVGTLLAGLVAPGGVVVADRDLGLDAWEVVALPGDAADWPYFIRRRPPAA